MEEVENGPWNPGLKSRIPTTILPLSTMFQPENVETDFRTAHELSDFCGLTPFELVVFRPQRLIVHSLLIRVTTQLSVPDGPDYEELGINLRAMVAKIYDIIIERNFAELEAHYEKIRFDATHILGELLGELRGKPSNPPSKSSGGLFGWFSSQKRSQVKSDDQFEDRLTRLEALLQARGDSEPTLKDACIKALLYVVHRIISHRGRLLGDDETIILVAVGQVLNDWGSLQLDKALSPFFKAAAAHLNYVFLPAQDAPLIMNVKGASASGKSTIRPQQRILAEQLRVAWRNFALISPDYWRKYLLDYGSLGPHAKYGAMLTGHELVLIDQKLDRQMAERALVGQIPHLLIDRFRFDSFKVGDDQSSKLLTRFGHTVYMFYMITPPHETVVRAYKRGLRTGRYKAVDDLLSHNVEAYTGMPSLFFSWALSDKKVHHEFLDNDVPEGHRPRTVAFGWNDELTILDVSKMLDIERYKKIDVAAKAPGEVLVKNRLDAEENLGFILECARTISCIRFADQRSGQLYGVMRSGEWVMSDVDSLKKHDPCHDTIAALDALGWSSATKVTQNKDFTSQTKNSDQDFETLGEWRKGG